MALEVYKAVWASPLYKGGRLTVLLAMAEFASRDGGGVWPSLDTLADMTRQSTRQVRTHIAAMLGDGVIELVAEARRHKPREYRIVLDRLRGEADFRPNDLGRKPASALEGENAVGRKFSTHRAEVSDAEGGSRLPPNLKNPQENLRARAREAAPEPQSPAERIAEAEERLSACRTELERSDLSDDQRQLHQAIANRIEREIESYRTESA